MMALSDFRPIFLYEFKLNQSAAETAGKFNQTVGNDSVIERTIRRWFAKFRSADFRLEDFVIPSMRDGGRTGRQLPCGF